MPSTFDIALDPFAETLEWIQDAAPHKRGSFRAVVLHGESQADTAGPTRGGFPADPWTVHVPEGVALVAEIAVGDTLARAEHPRTPSLSVQQITADDSGWVIRCTANARAPR